MNRTPSRASIARQVANSEGIGTGSRAAVKPAVDGHSPVDAHRVGREVTAQSSVLRKDVRVAIGCDRHEVWNQASGARSQHLRDQVVAGLASRCPSVLRDRHGRRYGYTYGTKYDRLTIRCDTAQFPAAGNHPGATSTRSYMSNCDKDLSGPSKHLRLLEHLRAENEGEGDFLVRISTRYSRRGSFHQLRASTTSCTNHQHASDAALPTGTSGRTPPRRASIRRGASHIPVPPTSSRRRCDRDRRRCPRLECKCVCTRPRHAAGSRVMNRAGDR